MNTLRKLIFIAVSGSALACVANAEVNSADPSPAAPSVSSQDAAKHRRAQLIDRLKEMSQELNLTEDQRAKIKTIFEEERPEVQSIRNDTSLAREQKREKLKSVRSDIRSRVEAILTPEQKKKWAEMRKKRQE